MADEVVETPDAVAPDTTEVVDSGKTFTQADLDKVVEQRLARERKKYADYDDLKAAQARLAEIEASQMSEHEKVLARAEAAEARAAELEIDIWSAGLYTDLLAEAVKSDRNIVDAQAVIDFLTGTDSDLLELDENGNPTDVADAMDKLLEKRPYLVGAARRTTPSADQGAYGSASNQITEAELATMTPQEIVKAREDGRLRSLMLS